MKNIFITTLSIVLTISANAQTFKEGDTIKIGKGSRPDGNFTYFSNGNWATKGRTSNSSVREDYNAMPKIYSYTTAKVIKVKNENVIVVKVNAKALKTARYEVLVKQAIESKELLAE